MHGLLYEAVAQTRPARLRTEVCTAIRSLTAGIEPFYPLSEAAQPQELSPDELHHPLVQRLGRLSADAAVWIPDLFSAVKEQRAGDMINLALARQREHRCSLQAAVILAIRQINSTIEEVQKLRAEVEPELSPMRHRLRGRHDRLDQRVLPLVPHRAALRRCGLGARPAVTGPGALREERIHATYPASGIVAPFGAGFIPWCPFRTVGSRRGVRSTSPAERQKAVRHMATEPRQPVSEQQTLIERSRELRALDAAFRELRRTRDGRPRARRRGLLAFTEPSRTGQDRTHHGSPGPGRGARIHGAVGQGRGD